MRHSDRPPTEVPCATAIPKRAAVPLSSSLARTLQTYESYGVQMATKTRSQTSKGSLPTKRQKAKAAGKARKSARRRVSKEATSRKREVDEVATKAADLVANRVNAEIRSLFEELDTVLARVLTAGARQPSDEAAPLSSGESVGLVAEYAHTFEPDDALTAVQLILARNPSFVHVYDAVVRLLADAVQSTTHERSGGDGRVISPEQLDNWITRQLVANRARANLYAQEMLDASAVSELLGSTSDVNRRRAASDARRRSLIVGLPRGNRYVFPAFQFDAEQRRVWPAVAQVNEMLGAADDPWGVASWWLTPNSLLPESQRPADLAPFGERSDDLTALAKAEREPVG